SVRDVLPCSRRRQRSGLLSPPYAFITSRSPHNVGHYDYEYDENPGTPRTAAPGAEGYGVNALAEQLDHATCVSPFVHVPASMAWMLTILSLVVEPEYTTDPDPERKRDRKDDRTGHPKKDGKRD